MDRIATLIDDALAAQLGSAAAVSVGDAGREVFRHVAGRTRRLPDLGPKIDETTPFDVASPTKPMCTVACAMRLVTEPLGLAARFAPAPIAGAVATELDERGLVCGLVHDENAYFAGRICGHAGVFASIADVATFAAAIVTARPPFERSVLDRFF